MASATARFRFASRPPSWVFIDASTLPASALSFSRNASTFGAWASSILSIWAWSSSFFFSASAFAESLEPSASMTLSCSPISALSLAISSSSPAISS